MLFLSVGPFAFHLALDPGVEVVEEVVVGLLGGRFAFDGARDLLVVVSLHGPRASFLGDLFLEFLDDEVGRVARFA
jgi:hypothetical protein